MGQIIYKIFAQQPLEVSEYEKLKVNIHYSFLSLLGQQSSFAKSAIDM